MYYHGTSLTTPGFADATTQRRAKTYLPPGAEKCDKCGQVFHWLKSANGQVDVIFSLEMGPEDPNGVEIYQDNDRCTMTRIRPLSADELDRCRAPLKSGWRRHPCNALLSAGRERGRDPAEEITGKLLALKARDATWEEAAAELGLRYYYVARLCGVREMWLRTGTPSRVYPDARQVIEMKALRAQGLSMVDTAIRMHLDPGWVALRLSELEHGWGLILLHGKKEWRSVRLAKTKWERIVRGADALAEFIQAYGQPISVRAEGRYAADMLAVHGLKFAPL